MSAATLGTKLLTKELTKKMRSTTRNGGRDPGVNAPSSSIQRAAISVRSIRTSPMAAASQSSRAPRDAAATERGSEVHSTYAVNPTATARRRKRRSMALLLRDRDGLQRELGSLRHEQPVLDVSNVPAWMRDHIGEHAAAGSGLDRRGGENGPAIVVADLDESRTAWRRGVDRPAPAHAVRAGGKWNARSEEQVPGLAGGLHLAARRQLSDVGREERVVHAGDVVHPLRGLHFFIEVPELAPIERDDVAEPRDREDGTLGHVQDLVEELVEPAVGQ